MHFYIQFWRCQLVNNCFRSRESGMQFSSKRDGRLKSPRLKQIQTDDRLIKVSFRCRCTVHIECSNLFDLARVLLHIEHKSNAAEVKYYYLLILLKQLQCVVRQGRSNNLQHLLSIEAQQSSIGDR